MKAQVARRQANLVLDSNAEMTSRQGQWKTFGLVFWTVRSKENCCPAVSGDSAFAERTFQPVAGRNCMSILIQSNVAVSRTANRSRSTCTVN